MALSDGDELTDAVSTDDGAKEGVLVVLDRTPFYAESGGQVADTGVIATAGGAHLAVTACKKTPKGYYVHTCTLLDGVVQAGDKVIASVERDRRHAIMRNHTGAHLLQKLCEKCWAPMCIRPARMRTTSVCASTSRTSTL